MVNFLETLSAGMTNATLAKEAYFEPSGKDEKEFKKKLFLNEERNSQLEADGGM